jgi:hypothetical protein
MTFLLAITGLPLLGQNEIENVKEKLPKMLGSNNAGKDFWFSFHPCWETEGANNALKIYVSSGIATQVTLEVPGKGVHQAKTTIPNDIIEFTLTPGEGQCYQKTDQQPPKPDAVYPAFGVHVFADQPIVVYGVTRYQYTSDGFLALPTNSLGKEYRVASYADPTDNTFQWLPSYTSITAAYDGTVVNFYMGGNNYTVSAGNLYYPQIARQTMNKGDVWLIASARAYGDLSGSKVKSSKPVAVTSGNFCAYIPTDKGYCDFIIEEELPTYTWGKEYMVTRIANRLNGSIIKVFSQDMNTKIYRNGRLIQLIPKDYGWIGDGYIEMRANSDITDRSPAVISGDKPISVTQYNPGQEDDGIVSDPFQLVLTPIEQYQKEIIFNTPGIKGGYGFPTNYVNLVFKKGDTQITPDDLQFGQANAGTILWKKVSSLPGAPEPFDTLANGDQYYNKIISLDGEGVYKLKGDKPFAAYAYGFSDYDSYGFPTSVALGDLSKPDTVAPTPIWTIACDGNVNDGFVRDQPPDITVRSNLSMIVYDDVQSYNYIFTYKEFMPGEDSTTTWKLEIKDPTKDAKAVITFSDRRGNDTTIVIQFFASNIAIRDTIFDYGLLSIGDTQEHQFWAINDNANAPATIRDIRLKSGSQGFELLDLSLPFVLAPKDSIPFRVRFTATQTKNGKFIDSIGIGDTCIFAYKTLVEAAVGEPIIHVTSPGNLGDVSLGKTKSGDVTIYNRGGVDLKIYGHTEPTQPVFTHNFPPTVSYTNPMIIKPGENYLFQVTFKPNAEGNFPPGINALDSMVFFNNANKTDSTAYFAGRGIQGALSASSIKWKPLRIDRPGRDRRGPYPATSDYCDVNIGGILLQNTGSQEVKIDHITTTGDIDGFTLNSGTFINMTIPAQSDTIIPVTFTPTRVGTYTMTISYVNSVNSNTQTVLSGTGILPHISTSDVNFDTTIVKDVANPQTRKIRFTNELWQWSDSLTITDFISNPDINAISPDWSVYGSSQGFKYDKTALALPINIQPGNFVEFNAAFVAQKPGDAAGSLTSVSDAETDVTSNWKGFGLFEGITAQGDSDIICSGVTSLLKCTIQNTGTASLTVTSIVIDQTVQAFFFNDPNDANGFLLQPGDIRYVYIRFQPSAPGHYTANLVVNSNSLDNPVTTANPPLSGTAVHYTRNVSITVDPNFKNPSIQTKVPVVVSFDPGADILLAGLKEIDCKIKYTGKFLSPVKSDFKLDSSLQGKFVIQNLVFDDINDAISFNVVSNGTEIFNDPVRLADMKFDTYLPTAADLADTSRFTITATAVDNPCTDITTTGDSLHLQRTCAYDLRKILVNVGLDYTFNEINPNPVSNSGGNFEFSIAFDGFTRLDIFNSNGDMVLSPIAEDMTAGIHTVRIPVESLPSGFYICKFVSGPFVATKEMIIAK